MYIVLSNASASSGCSDSSINLIGELHVITILLLGHCFHMLMMLRYCCYLPCVCMYSMVMHFVMLICVYVCVYVTMYRKTDHFPQKLMLFRVLGW